MKNPVCAVTLALLFLAAPAAANEALKVEGGHDFAAQKQQIVADLGEGKRYAEIKPADLEKVRAALTRMDKVLSTTADTQSLDEWTKVSIFNDQELINTILTEAGEDSRVVCERTRKIGSQRMESTCKTVAERRRDRVASQDYHRHHPQFRPPVNED
ncbi:hypothetical protein BH23PSE2_BH23PSE2_10110 [soil metagenome]